MLRAIYKGGSSVILPKPNDEDYYYYYDTREERLEALKHNKNHSVDNHYKVWQNHPKIFIDCYNYFFHQKIEGEDMDLSKFDLFEKSTKAQYFELVRKFIATLPKNNKKWYHVYLIKTLYEKGKVAFTKKELQIAQNIHDKGVSDEEYNDLIEYFN